MEIRHRSDSERIRKALEEKFNVGLDHEPVDMVDENLHMHTLSDAVEEIQSFDEENPQAISQGDHEEEPELVAEKFFGISAKEHIDFKRRRTL